MIKDQAVTMVIPQLKINSERLKANFDALAEIGATNAGGVSRLALSNQDLEARAWFAEQAELGGLEVRDDEAGNLSALLACPDPQARTLLIGSHLDTVPNGGRYDGAIGVLAGLECLQTIREAGLHLPVHLEVIDFTDEEGCWQSLFGSRAVAGKLRPEHLNDTQQDNAPFRAALYRAGITPKEVHRAKRNPKQLLAYLELHIEQGYHLDEEGIDIGVVSGIVGRSTYALTFLGEASHSGTTAPNRRRDAFHGAAAFVLKAYQLVREEYPRGIFNCGDASVSPGAFNIIPSEAHLTIEFRHPDQAILTEMETSGLDLAAAIARQYGLELKSKCTQRMPAVKMAEPVLRVIEGVCRRHALSHRRLVSYAGHDAQMMSTITPSAMIFIPSVNGISHSPKEYTPWEAIEKGAHVLLDSILDIALHGLNKE